MTYTHIIIHYDEIVLKGGNRPFFERMLVNNIQGFSKKINYEKIYKDGGKIIIKMNEKTDGIKAREILENIPGISNFAFAILVEKDIEKIKEKILEWLRSGTDFEKHKTFRVSARRADKSFPLNSLKINTTIGDYVLDNSKLKVDIHNPQLEIIVDVGSKDCYIYFEKIRGVGGLPSGTAGKLVSLLSGGIDSPVASFMMMKRGAKIIFVHFKNRTIVSAGAEEKINKLVEILSKFQGKSKLYVVPFEEFQTEIIANIPAENRMIVYKRIMFKLSEMIARKEKAKGIVTGDSLSQVASQTLENIGVIYRSVALPVFSPLIGMNKLEIVNLAEKIGTLETSNIQYQDCCSFLVARHPETKANAEKIRLQEENLRIEELAKKIIDEIKPITIGD